MHGWISRALTSPLEAPRVSSFVVPNCLVVDAVFSACEINSLPDNVALEIDNINLGLDVSAIVLSTYTSI